MNIFNKIPLLKPKRNVFNLGFENRLSTDLFRLTPIFCKEALPDDVFNIRPEIFARVMPALNAPVMQRFNIRTYFFFVPTRLIWSDFEKWINPKSGVSDIVAPRIKFDDWKAYDIGAPKTLGDYLGVNFGLSPEDYASLGVGYGRLNLFPVKNSDVTDKFKFPEISVLPFRAYKKIYNDWFIDLNNFEGEPELDTSSGVIDLHNEDNPAAYTDEQAAFAQEYLQMRFRAWEHDYFTSAMPDPQRGPDVMAFDGGSLEIDSLNIAAKDGASNITSGISELKGDFPAGYERILIGQNSYINPGAITQNFYADLGYTDRNEADAALLDANQNNFKPDAVYIAPSAGAQGFTLYIKKKDGTFTNYLASASSLMKIVHGQADKQAGSPNALGTVSTNPADVAEKLETSGASATIQGVTVEELRIRMQMQSFLERNEVGGSRYTELLYAHWGVKDPDGRLQRAEFLGGSKQPLVINEVSQTSAPTDDDPLGQYAGQGTSSSVGRKIRYRVPEHGYIIGLMCIMPRTGYFQGIEPMWSRFDRLDYFWPSFAHLGEQEVKNKEVLFSGFDAEGTFGYQQRYAEYKASYDQAHGDMKGNLAFWHGARAFATPASEDDIPKLSLEFTTPDDSGADGVDRIFPVLSAESPVVNADHFVCDIYMHCVASRRMPKFVTPRNGS